MTEDTPGWDCATMGNRVCGSPDGTLTYHPEAGQPYVLADVRGTWDGVTLTPALLPDAAASVPGGLPIDGIGFVLLLAAVAAWRRITKRSTS